MLIFFQLPNVVSVSDILKLAALPPKNMPVLQGALGDFAGWGTLRAGQNGRMPVTLRSAQLEVMSQDQCIYHLHLFRQHVQFCTVFLYN